MRFHFQHDRVSRTRLKKEVVSRYTFYASWSTTAYTLWHWQYLLGRNDNTEQNNRWWILGFSPKPEWRTAVYLQPCPLYNKDIFRTIPYFFERGTGVGKSHLLKCLCQALHRYYDTVSCENPDEIKVVVGTPTTKAAFGVRGSTLHSLFALPANQSLSKYRHLDHSTLNTLRCKFAKLKLLIIDEVSMVGVNLFIFINNRL